MAKILDRVDYVLMQNTREFTNPYVMEVKKPYCIGLPLKLEIQKDAESIEDYMRSLANGECLAKVPGYSVFFLPAGTLTGLQATPEEMKAALEGMAKFYLEDYIEKHKHPFRRSEEGYISGTDEAIGRRFKEMKEARRAARRAQQEEE